MTRSGVGVLRHTLSLGVNNIQSAPRRVHHGKFTTANLRSSTFSQRDCLFYTIIAVFDTFITIPDLFYMNVVAGMPATYTDPVILLYIP